jgi:hypothetical protein
MYKKNCRKEKSMFKGSFFSTTKLKINDLLWLAYMYLNKTPIAGIMATSNIKSEATTAWTKYIRQLLADNVSIEEVQIGDRT